MADDPDLPAQPADGDEPGPGDDDERDRAPVDGDDGDEPAHRDGDRTAGTDGDGRSREGDGRTGAAAAGSEKTKRKIADVINVFHDQVNAGLIGMGTAAGTGPRITTGRLDDDEVRADRRHYRPPDVFDDAVPRLKSDHVLVIYGPAGLGKRAGAVNLLREATNDQLVVMSSVTELKGLATRSYIRGYGYLIVNRTETAQLTDPDLTWRTVRDQVRAAGAYLVVTTTTPADPRVTSVRHVAWQRPDVRAMLRGYLAEADRADEAVDAIMGQVTDDCSMTDLAEVARRVADGEDHETALKALAERSVRRVEEWFDAPRKPEEVIDVAVLAFLDKVTNREFESARGWLEAAMLKHNAIKASAKRKRKAIGKEFLVRRLHRLREEGLITDQRVPGRTSDRRVLVFRHPGYRRQVLVELCRRVETPFWDAIAEWLGGIVTVRSNPEVAEGLALLAAVDFDEVDVSYLKPWSAGRIGTSGQATAVYVLWWMCYAEDTLPVALKVAKQWANHGDPEQRWAAAMAYSGELGACDPAHAIKQLWHLVIQSSTGYEQACMAMASLFTTLLAETDDAGKVLSTLERQLHRAITRPGDSQVVTRAHRVLAELLVVRESRRRIPATFSYLEKYPDRIDSVARLWAKAICHRGYRKVVLGALWTGLNRLGQITDDPLGLAGRLGEALAAALPDHETDDFLHDLGVVDARRRDRAAHGRSPALVLLEVVERCHRRKAS